MRLVLSIALDPRDVVELRAGVLHPENIPDVARRLGCSPDELRATRHAALSRDLAARIAGAVGKTLEEATQVVGTSARVGASAGPLFGGGR